MKAANRSKLLGEIDARQRNTIWPDTLRNAAFVDAFLWKGSPEATSLQRIGIALFGLLFLSPAVLLVCFWFLGEGSALLRTLMLLFALPWAAIACKLFRNAFRHLAGKPQHHLAKRGRRKGDGEKGSDAFLRR